jgi:hypothetical protein
MSTGWQTSLCDRRLSNPVALQVIMELLNFVKCGRQNYAVITSVALKAGQTAGYEYFVSFLLLQLILMHLHTTLL